MGGRGVLVGVLVALLGCAAMMLGACSSDAGRHTTASPRPASVAGASPAPISPAPALASSTPPAVQRTVAAGTTLQADDTSSATAHSHEHGHAHGHMHHPASVVPNGTGPHVVAVPDSDGCDHSYGTPTQCIPLRAPGGGRMTCAVLREYHFLPLLVTRDRLDLLAAQGSTTRRVGGRTYLTGCTA